MLKSPDCDPDVREAVYKAILEDHKPKNVQKPTELNDLDKDFSLNVAPYEPNVCESDSNNNSLTSEVHWKEWEEKALINNMKEKGELFQQNKNHETIWNTISKGLKDNGISVSTQQVKNRWKNLKKTYKRIIDENKSTGNGRSQWKYLDEFNDMYGHNASTIPALVFDSGNSAGKRFSKQVKESNPENKNDKKEKETCREQRGKKRSSTVTVSDLLSKMEDQNENFTKIVKEQHEEKMNRFDRFLDLYESSLKKS